MGLSKNLIFKPEKPLPWTEEDEKQLNLFFKMLDKNGTAYINCPEKEVTEKQIAEKLKSGELEVVDYTDYSGKTGIKDYLTDMTALCE